jgi:transposase InsO family protein
VGLPEAIVVELLGDADQNLDGQALGGLAGVPFLNPEAVWVDRGRVFISRAFRDACVRLGIDLEPYWVS